MTGIKFTISTIFTISSPVRMYRKSYCTVPGVLFGAGVCGGFGVSKINIRVLRLSF